MNLDDALALASRLMDRHGLHGWRFAFDRSKKRFGCCDCLRRRITLSAPLTEANDSDDVQDVILHEIAHALAGPGTGHSQEWKRIAQRIGCRPERCFSWDRVKPAAGTWVGTCPSCRGVYRRAKLPPGGMASCGKCSSRGKFNPAAILQWCQAEPAA